MDNRKVKRTIKESQTINSDTGEVLSSTATSVSYSKEPDFIKLYLDDLIKISNLPAGANKTIYALLPKMNYDNEIVLSKSMKDELCQKLSIKINSFEHNLGDLVANGILMKKSNNHYLMNPNYYARGTWSDISRLRMTVTYTKDGKFISVETSGKEIPFTEFS